MSASPPGGASSLDKFSFTTVSPDGTRLACVLERKPTLTKHSGTCVLVAHGLGQDKSSPAIRGLAESLPYNVCTYDARGLGDSSGDASICDYKDAVEDMSAVADKLGSLGLSVHTVLGVSKGGEVGMMFAQQFPSKIRQLVTLGAHFDLSRYDECQLTPAQLRQIQSQGYIVWKRYGRNNNPRFWIIRKEDLRLRAAVDVHTPMSRISSHVKILVLHGGEDEIVPKSEAKKYGETMAGRPNFAWTVLEGVTHACATSEEIRKVVEVVERWTEGEGLGEVTPETGYLELKGAAEPPPQLVRRGSAPGPGAAQPPTPNPGLSPALLAEFLEMPSELAADKWALDSLTPPYTTGARSRTNSVSNVNAMPKSDLDLLAETGDVADGGSRRSSMSALSAALSSAGIGPKPVTAVRPVPAPGVSGLAQKPYKGLAERAAEEESSDSDDGFRMSP